MDYILKDIEYNNENEQTTTIHQNMHESHKIMQRKISIQYLCCDVHVKVGNGDVYIKFKTEQSYTFWDTIIGINTLKKKTIKQRKHDHRSQDIVT